MSPNHLIDHLPRFQEIYKIAKKQKVEPFLVGGALRDHRLGRACADFDFAVSHGSIKIAKALAKRIKGAFVLLDEEHHCARVARKEKGLLWTYDFADLRAKDLLGDLRHRDFTINSMAVSLKDLTLGLIRPEQWIDPLKGLRDLAERKIKMVSTKAFCEDPLRLIRAFSHQAVLGFSIEQKTLKQIKKDHALLHHVASERVRDEFFKILLSPCAINSIKAMDRLGLIEQMIPQVTLMYSVPRGGYHHLPLWKHSLETFHQLEKIFSEAQAQEDLKGYLLEPLAFGRSRYALLKLAAIVHDVGKPETQKKEQGKTSFHGHERVGRSIVREVSKNLKLSTKERVVLENMVLHHLRPGYLSNFKKPTARAIFRYFRDTGDEAVSILLLSLADQRSTRGPLTTEKDQRHHEKIVRMLIDQYFENKKQQPRVRLLTGDDLIKKLKLSPSPIFKKILTAVEEQHALGKIQTKSQALDLAKGMIKR